MSANMIQLNNSPTAITARYTSAQLAWWPVLLFLPARFVFALVAQGLVAATLALGESADAWRAAASSWPIYSTLTDIFCLLALAWLTRREGLALIDLFGLQSRPVLRQLLWTPVYLLAVLPGSIIAFFISQLFYGSTPPPLFTVINLPPLATWYVRLIWPVIWVITEELVYLGYLLPRVESITKRKWVACLVVIFFWGLQHLAIPWLSDGTYLTWRALSAVAAIMLFPFVFVVGGRRLIPFMAIHYLADLSTALIATGVIPYQ